MAERQRRIGMWTFCWVGDDRYFRNFNTILDTIWREGRIECFDDYEEAKALRLLNRYRRELDRMKPNDEMRDRMGEKKL